MPEIDFINSAQDCILEHGFHLPNTPITTGKVIRFSTGDTPDSDVNGWGYFNINPDGSYFGKIGDHVTKQEYTFFQGNQKSLTQKERKEIDAAIKKEQAKREAKQAQAIKEVRQMLSRAQPADRKHPYLAKKQVRPYGLLQINNALIVPMQDIYGNIMSAQTITPDGKKKFYPGCPIKGGSFIIGDITPGCIIAIVEGFATGATIHKILGIPVVVAFSSGNLLAVAQQLKEKHPDNDRVLFADNDLETAEKTGKNPGKEAAEEAARLTGARVCLCPVNSDFNDLFIARGTDAVREAAKKRDTFHNTPQHGFRLVSISDMQFRPPDWLIKGIMEKCSLNQIFGDPGCGKSFIGVDIACCVATGTPWHEKTVKQGLVIYVAGEGFNGLHRRFRAWGIRHQTNLKGAPLYISTCPASLTEKESLETVIQAISEIGQNPAVVILDTLARNFGPGDENSTQDMTKFIHSLDMIKSEYGCAIILIHHSGHADKKRARGAMALKGALDTEYNLEKDDSGTVRMTCTKIKDFEPPDGMAFKIRGVDLGINDEDGKPLSSAILDSVEYSEPQKTSSGKGKWQSVCEEILTEKMAQYRENLKKSGHDPNQASVTIQEVKEEAINRGMESKVWYRYFNYLKGLDWIETSDREFMQATQTTTNYHKLPQCLSLLVSTQTTTTPYKGVWLCRTNVECGCGERENDFFFHVIQRQIFFPLV